MFVVPAVIHTRTYVCTQCAQIRLAKAASSLHDRSSRAVSATLPPSYTVETTAPMTHTIFETVTYTEKLNRPRRFAWS